MSWKISLFALALLSLCAPLSATVIYVSGDQTGSWLADTVIVTAEVRVPPGQSLTIVPGVEVLFSVYCKLIVDSAATLRAVGTAVDSIRFDVLSAVPDTAWHGIRFLSASDSSRLEYCHLTHGHATGGGEDHYGGAIYCSNAGPNISHCNISANSAFDGGGIYCSDSNPTVSNNTISGNTVGLPQGAGGGISISGGSPTISGNTIYGNAGGFDGGGIWCGDNSSPTLSGNTISGNTAYSLGGGIHCDHSSPTISGNTISDNEAWYWGGGGICCWDNSNPTISSNTINGNSANWGGGIRCYSSNPTVSSNTISGNSVSAGGGGIDCYLSSPNISGNTISQNQAGTIGGGIDCDESSPVISDNTISENSANWGGGICCYLSSSSISGNTIRDNTSTLTGGGVYCETASPVIIGNTISGNSAPIQGGGISCILSSNPTIIGNTISGNSATACGGIYCGSASASLVNCILWDNRGNQIAGTPNVTYSDIQGGYPGTGNIATYPAFVDTAQGDYRLQWGSPCIDSGDPNPIYNDPDDTRADMGAWYYDQSLPVRILLTPYNAPIQIPPEGGSFQYAIQATNIEDTTLSFRIWCNLTLPSGTTYGPVLGPVPISLGSGLTISRVRTQNIPGHAPAGMYEFNAFAVAAGYTSEDNFVFTKLGAAAESRHFVGDLGLGAGDWSNTGESLEGREEAVLIHPSSFRLQPSYPNPFNPTTDLSYQLPMASHVSLRIYDMAGRLVAELVSGRRDVGAHQITFDGSGLPSGIYFAKLTAENFSQVQKLVLMK